MLRRPYVASIAAGVNSRIFVLKVEIPANKGCDASYTVETFSCEVENPTYEGLLLKMIRFRYLTMCVIASAVLSSAALEGSEAGILAFGDLRGHLEPCGCDPRTDVGGLKRVSAAVRRYRSQFKNIPIVNLGNGLKADKNDSSSEAIDRVLQLISPDASLININEWERHGRKQRLPSINWVLSNSAEQGDASSWSRSLTVFDYEIFGYLGLKAKGLEPFSPYLLKQWTQRSQARSSSKRILLFSGHDKDLAKILDSRFFGTIIRSSKVPLGVEVGDAEQANERLLVTRHKSHLVWSVPFGGAGLLRVAGLEKSLIPKPLIFSDSNTQAAPKGVTLGTPNSDQFPQFSLVKYIHWLRLEEESAIPSEIIQVYDELRRSETDKFKNLVTLRTKDLQDTEFVGAEACASCHASSYEVWKRSSHSSAMNTLLLKKRHEDASCVECHVLGFKEKGGYVSEVVSPKFSNVQCENCHGPRKSHILNPSQKITGAQAIDPKKSCAECHTPPHSPGFDPKKYWKSIEHK